MASTRVDKSWERPPPANTLSAQQPTNRSIPLPTTSAHLVEQPVMPMEPQSITHGSHRCFCNFCRSFSPCFFSFVSPSLVYSGLWSLFGQGELRSDREGATNSAPNLFSFRALPWEVDVRFTDIGFGCKERGWSAGDENCILKQKTHQSEIFKR